MVKKVAIGCQGGGMHAAFEVGVLTEILKNIDDQKKQNNIKFELVGLSGTSAGALCAMMAWYGLAPKNGSLGSEQEAMDKLKEFWNDFVASKGAETVLNSLTYGVLRLEETEIPVLGIRPPIFATPNPYGAISRIVAASLPSLGVRKKYFDLHELLSAACPALENNSIDWSRVETRLLIGASEVINGLETVFDSDVNKGTQQKEVYYWRQRLRLSLAGVAASGTLPTFREAEYIKGGGCYWDGLYSQNPPVREFFANADVPDELWIVRINPQQWPELPKSNADVQDRENELMGNLSLHKELDFILQVNEWSERYKDEGFGKDHKKVIVRTIKMKEKTADELRYSSKFDRSRAFMQDLRDQGHEAARDWLDDWRNNKAGCYPEDAAYRKI